MSELNKIELETTSGGESGWYYLGKATRAVVDFLSSGPSYSTPYYQPM